LTFVSIALDILSTEMASCLCGTNSDDKRMQMLESAFANDSTKLAPMSRRFAGRVAEIFSVDIGKLSCERLFCSCRRV
jgi:hypothetical protein